MKGIEVTKAFRIISFPYSRAASILALGGQRGCFCLARGGEAFLSPDFGDLSETENLLRYQESLMDLVRALAFRPRIIAHDLHPDYLTTRWAFRLVQTRFPDADLLGVQHHHAHIAAVLADRGENGPVVGLAWDGTGYGEDGTIWGGEVLIADRAGYRREGHLAGVPMPGGEKAVEEPWRMAVSYLHHFYGRDFLRLDLPFVRSLNRRSVDLLLAALEKGINAPLTSSIGRLFDAIAALVMPQLRGGVGQLYEGKTPLHRSGLHRAKASCPHIPRVTEAFPAPLGLSGRVGIERRPRGGGRPVGPAPPKPWAKAGDRAYNGYVGRVPRPSRGGQASRGVNARALEEACARGEHSPYPFAVNRRKKPFVIDCGKLVDGVVQDIRRRVPRPVIAARFHRTVIEIGMKAAGLSASAGTRRVVLGGGVFLNRIVREGLSERLRAAGFAVILPEGIPVHDGGIALGQAWVAADKHR
ncbi:MAG: hypothetical protein NTV79_01740 [Candidatus Aureabacteria bacterium]|nr:hypothetical protein [Candidatus Auribacterota bacterium]